MNRKMIFVQGVIIIAFTMVANVILSNWIFSERIEKIKAGQNSLVRSIDHIFTALTYLEKNSTTDIHDKVIYELDEARKTLRAPELISIRREVEE